MATLSSQPGLTGDSYGFTPSALVIAERPDRARAATEALAMTGIRVAAEARFAEAVERLGDVIADLIVIDAQGAGDAELESVLLRANQVAEASGARVLAAIGEDQIDLAAAQLFGRRRQLLCSPSLSEWVGALATAKAPPAAQLHQPGRDAESERLHRLNEEVARIADTLARLTRGEEGERRRGVRAPGPDYRGPDDGANDDTSAQEIRAVIRARRLRAQYFTGELFADPAWDMLLDLFAAELESRRVSVSSLCIAAAVPPTTALRWIGTLHEAGLFERHADPSDRRRAYIGLTAKGLDGMRCYVASAKRQGLPLV